jgi:hypothetical protein
MSSIDDTMCEEFIEGNGAECVDCGLEVPRKLLNESFLEGGCETAGEGSSELCRRDVS